MFLESINKRTAERVRLVGSREVLLHGALIRQCGYSAKKRDAPLYPCRTTAVHIPDWLRARLEHWYLETHPEQIHNGHLIAKMMLMQALYEVSSKYEATASEDEALQSLEVETESKAIRTETDGSEEPEPGPGASPVQGVGIRVDEGLGEPTLAVHEGGRSASVV